MVADTLKRSAQNSALSPLPFGSISWVAIAVFYSVAVLISAPFNLGVLDSWLRDTFPGTPLAQWTFLPAALGPFLGALIARRIDTRSAQQMTTLGDHVGQSLFITILPIGLFSSIGGVGLILPCVALIYAMGEEYGWRGFLADALNPFPPSARYILTALLWWPWHLRFETTFDWIGFPLLVLASCWFLGHAAKESRSVLVAAAMHASVILLTANGPLSNPLIIAGLLTLGGWVLVGFIFPSKSSDAV
jgi:CAAX protease family protein